MLQVCFPQPVSLRQGSGYGGGAGSLLLNIIWLLVTGLPLAVAHALWGCVLCITIIGIPFGRQFFKIARLALTPFGSRVVEAY